MSYKFCLLVVAALVFTRGAGAASCFSLPSPPVDPVGVLPYSASHCYVGGDFTSGGVVNPMPVTGFAIGTSCLVDASTCLNSQKGGLSYATCLQHPVTGEGYWTQPVCEISVDKSFQSSLTADSVLLGSNVEYASAVHLNNVSYTSVTSVQIPYHTAAPTSGSDLVVRFYSYASAGDETQGPGDLLYTAAAKVPTAPAASASTFSVNSVNGVQCTMFGVSTTAGTLTVFMPTPLNLGNDFFVSMQFSSPSGAAAFVGASAGVALHYWQTSVVGQFVSPTQISAGAFASVVSAVNVLAYVGDGYPCQPTMLSASIGYSSQPGSVGNGFDSNEPPMPYLDFTRSSILASSGALQLVFTYPTGVYDDVEYLPWNASSAFGAEPALIASFSGCETTYQTVSVTQEGCTTTAKVQANFASLISGLENFNSKCGWTQSPDPVQYQGVYYTQWSGRIQIVTYQTVGLLDATTVRAKAGYAWVVVRSPIVTSDATAVQGIVDESVFKWTIVSQNLITDLGTPYNSTTLLTTQVTAGYELEIHWNPTVTSNSKTAWFFDAFNAIGSNCPGSTPCTQSWALTVQQKDPSVCSLDASVDITFISRCGASLMASGGCDPSLIQQFNVTLALSSVDFCKVVGGVTSLGFTDLALSPPTSSQVASAGLAGSSAPAAPALFAVGASLGVFMSIQALPAIPITLQAVSAVLYESSDPSHSTSFSSVTSMSAPNYFAATSVSAGLASAFFNVPTGDNTPWLEQESGLVHSVRLSVTATVSYDASSLGHVPVVLAVNGVPSPSASLSRSASSASSASISSKFQSLAQDIRAAATQAGSITSTSQVFSIQGNDAASPASGPSTGVIAGATVGAVAATAVVVTVVVLAMGKSAAAASAAAAAASASAASASAGAAGSASAGAAAASASSAAASIAPAVVPAAVV